MRRIRIHAVLAMLCGAAVLSSCGTIPGSGPDDEDALPDLPQSFTIVYAKDDLSHIQGITSVIGAFEKSHPNIVIDEGNETWTGSYAEYLRMKEAVGGFPDLVEMNETQPYADAGLLYEMPEDLAGMLKDIPEVNGRIYNLPLDMPAPQGIIYSKAAFKQAGIYTLPKTFGDFLAVCDKIAKLGVNPIIVGGKDPEQLGMWINQFLIDEVYADNPDWNAERSEGKASWSDPGPVKAMSKLASLWKRGYIAPEYQSMAENQMASELVSGQAAMLLACPWMFNQIKAADPSFEYGFFALKDEGGKLNTDAKPVAAGWAISAAAAKDPAKLEAITQFLHYFYDEDQYPRYLQAVNGIPSTKEQFDYPAPEAMNDVLRAMNGPDVTNLVPIQHYTGHNTPPPLFCDWFFQTAPEWLSGNTSVEKAMREADLKWDEMKTAERFE